MKIDRLMAITNYLLCHGRTSAQKLAREFEVSVRTIARDMDTLGQAGIPIQSTYGADGGYGIIDTYVMNKKLMNHQDYEDIITALRGLLSAYTSKSAKQTMDKILSCYDNEDNPVRLDFSVANEKKEINAQIGILEEAIRQQRAVGFQYTNSGNVAKQVQVEPVRLEFKWYNWYLIAYYPPKQDYCMYKLVRMENLVMLDEKNTMHHKNGDIVIHDERVMTAITLRGKAKIRSKCREYLNGEISKEYANGDFEFCFSVPVHESYWLGVVLSFGSDVKVLEPQSVMEHILAVCNEVKRNYEE